MALSRATSCRAANPASSPTERFADEVEEVDGRVGQQRRVTCPAQMPVPAQKGSAPLLLGLKEPPGQPLSAARPRAVVVEERVGGTAEDDPGHPQALEGIVRVRQIVQSIRQPVPLGLDGLRLKRRRPTAEVGLGQGPGTPGLPVGFNAAASSGGSSP
ncbi:hypothetical protein ACF07V_32325 [Streptomyces sp. NPDC015661]|uniref:hypothetical protein n=1 Tax=Streptomyces sp. NPDC015661 TaxID=3364961 RepID=UPI0036FEB041